MKSCGRLATRVDQEWLERVQGVQIASSLTPDNALTLKDGATLARELGGRYLIRYLHSDQLGTGQQGSVAPCYVTPTAYSPEDCVRWLALPNPAHPREFALILDPSKIPAALGPRWVRLGDGIEYLLPQGFPPEALVLPWEVRIS